MLKNKFKIIAILAVIILALTLPIVRAESGTENTDGTEEIVDTVNQNTEENFKRSDVYLTGDDVTIDYIVDGNLFVFANTVTINSQIGGDAFICANSVTVGEQGYVFSNLFTFSKEVTVKGIVYDLYAASENLTINGYVYRDIRVGANTVNIFGTVGRNAYVNCTNLNLVPVTDESDEEETSLISQGMISGDLNYTAEQEASIPEGSVTGEITFEQETSFNTNTTQDKIISLVRFVITVIVIWLLCLWLAPNFLKKSNSLLASKKILPVIGFGILTPIIGIILAIILFIIGITSTVALLLMVTLFILIAISTSIFVMAINAIICNKLKIQKTVGILGMLIVSSVVLWLIALIPYIGSIISLIAVVLGFGIVIANLVLKEKEAKTEEN